MSDVPHHFVPRIAAQISVDTNESTFEDSIDLDLNEDEHVPMGSGFVFDDNVITELLSDRFGVMRAETEAEVAELIGTSVDVAGQRWTVTGDIPQGAASSEDFIEIGFRSKDVDGLPRRFRNNAEINLGVRSSPRLTPSKRGRETRDESIYINQMFEALFPVNWKQSLKRLNKAIADDQANTRKKCSKAVSEKEYWIFIGLLVLCGVQKTGGIDGCYNNKETKGIIKSVNAHKYMSYTRFKFIKTQWVTQFELQVSDQEKEKNKWWRVGYLVQGYNNNRKQTVASSRIKTLDESMSAYRPQTNKTGNLPNISYILRKPEPLGTELKTVASTGSNGPIIYAEIQEGKDAMKTKSFFSTYGSTTACVMRLGKGTKDCGQRHDPNVRNLFYGDSWFASLKTAVACTEELDSEFLGPIKTAHRQFPKKYIEDKMNHYPPGSHLVMETTVRGNKYYGIGYKYNMKKVLCFVATEGAGHTGPGTPYQAKWQDENGRIASRDIKRPHMLAEYFKNSNQIDKHNHARQSQLAVEKNLVTQDGYFRLWCTYLGMTVTDAWKLYRFGLDTKHYNKELSIIAFANILCETHLLNDYNGTANESTTNQPLMLLSQPSSRQTLDFPTQIVTTSRATALSSLASGSMNGLVQIGNGKYVPASFNPPHKSAQCLPTNQYIHAGNGSFTKKRRKRNRCRVCGAHTTCQCTVCFGWVCNPLSSNPKTCFVSHQVDGTLKEREAHWLSMQGK